MVPSEMDFNDVSIFRPIDMKKMKIYQKMWSFKKF